MTSHTRGRLMLCVILGLLILPAEALLLPVARTPDPAEAAIEWAAGRSPEAIVAAARDIDAYPTTYRRAIMRQLAPADRSVAWREYFNRYKAQHADLTPAQVAVIDEAIGLASADALGLGATAQTREQIKQLFNRAIELFGTKGADELFVSMGPKALTRANALPMMQRLADNVRSWRVVSAEAPDCNCNVDIDLCDLEPDPWLACSEQYTCNFDLDWPMCGPLWSWACTGWCKMIRMPQMN
jgi:hypothetical protein